MLRDLIYPTQCLSCRKGFTLHETSNLDLEKQYLYQRYSLHVACYQPLAFALGERRVEQVPAFFMTPSTYLVQSIVLRAKEKRDQNAIAFMARYIHHGLLLLSLQNSIQLFELLPIPSRFSNRWRRGYSHLDLLVHELFKTHKRFSRSYEKIGISEAPLKVQRSALVLKHQRRVRDQRGLGNLQRSINMRNSMKLSIGRGRTDFLTGNCAVSSASLLRGFRDGGEDDSTLKTALVILDDVVTTGASVTEALRAVRCAGYHPDMVLSFAASVGGFKKEGKS